MRYKSKVTKVWFKNKKQGWRSIGTQIDFANGKSYFREGSIDPFMRLFVIDALIMRPNCQYCKFRTTHHISDFTVGDFWGIEKANPAIDDNKGVSALFVNTDKARNIFASIKDSMDCFETTTDDIVRDNFSVLTPKKTNPKMNEFMEAVERHGFMPAVYRYGSYTRKRVMCYNVHRFIHKIKCWLR